MKNYNKSFKVEITANMIADKFISNLNSELTTDRAEKFTDAVIGPMCSNNNTNGLKHLYYALFDLDVDAPLFKDTDDLMCAVTYYGWKEYQAGGDNDGDDFKVEMKRENIAIGQCKLIGFDTYREDRKYEIEYDEFNSKGEPSTHTKWVDGDNLELVSDKVEHVDA